MPCATATRRKLKQSVSNPIRPIRCTAGSASTRNRPLLETRGAAKSIQQKYQNPPCHPPPMHTRISPGHSDEGRGDSSRPLPCTSLRPRDDSSTPRALVSPKGRFVDLEKQARRRGSSVRSCRGSPLHTWLRPKDRWMLFLRMFPSRLPSTNDVHRVLALFELSALFG